MRFVLLVPVCILLFGCSDSSQPVASKRAQKIEKAAELINKTPKPHTYQIDSNQMVVIEVPTADEYGYVETQRCYIWRDAEFKTSSMSCPADQTQVPIATGGPTSDHH